MPLVRFVPSPAGRSGRPSIGVLPRRHASSSVRRVAARGFTLIELLIVVAIIGILAGIAYPSYGEYVKRTRRSDAHLSLLSAVQDLERCRATSFSYAGCTVAGSSSEGYYTIARASATAATTYTLTATATGAQTSDTDCATITLDYLGRQGPVASGASESTCWN